MKPVNITKNWGIQSRVLFLALVPLLTVSIIVGYYLTSIQLEHARQSLLTHGSTITKDLARSCEFSVAIGDTKQLQHLVSATLSHPQVRSVGIYDANVQILASGRKSGFKNTAGDDPDNVQFVESVTPVQPGSAELKEFLGHDLAHTSLGKVVVTLSLSTLDKRQQEIIINGGLIVLAGALLSALLGIIMVRGVTAPIQRIIVAVGHIGQGRLTTRVRQSNTGNLGQLEAGINAMAETIQTSQQELHSRIRQATTKLAQNIAILKHQNTELEQARQAAQQASDAKATFLAQISHELRTPLNAIIGFTDLLSTETEDAGQQEYVQVINQASQQLLTVINDVLNLSSLEAGHLGINKISFSPSELLEDVVAMLSHEAHKKNLEIVLLIHQDAPTSVEGDPIRFTQILTNLINNAIKFTDSGEVVIIADARCADNGNQSLRVTVKDSGIGLNDVSIKSLFQPFIQADSSITKQFGGTGLGLAIAKLLAERMDGEINAFPNPDRGSSFWFTLPAARQMATLAIDNPPLAPQRVAIVESNNFARRAIRNLLLSFNISVFIKQGIEAVLTDIQQSKATEPSYDAVILGLNKAQARDPELAQAVHLLQTTGVKIIVLIGDEMTAREWASRAAANPLQVATKPLRRKTLIRLLGGPKSTNKLTPTSGPQKAPLPTLAVPSKTLYVLIAEDNAYSRQLLKIYLQNNGVEVDESSNGLEAVEKTNTQRYDFIFLDLHMPALDGAAACDLIRAGDNPNHGTPIIAITADIYFDAPDKTSGTQFTDTIHKPVTQKALQKILGSSTQPNTSADTDPDVLPPGLFAEIQSQLDALNQAYQSSDQVELKNRIHQLNGLIRYFAIDDLSATGLGLEQALNIGSQDQIQRQITELNKQINLAHIKS